MKSNQQQNNIETKEFWYEAGEKLYNENDYTEAIKKFNKALSLDKKYKEAWNKKGWALNNLKEYHVALDCFKQALEIDKEYKEAWRGKAQAHLNSGVKGDESFWQKLGDTLYELKIYAETIECYNRYFKVKGNSDGVSYHQARAFYEIGEYNKAITSCDILLKKYVKAYVKANYTSTIKGIDNLLKVKTFALWKLNRYKEITDCYNSYSQKVNAIINAFKSFDMFGFDRQIKINGQGALLLQKFGIYKEALNFYSDVSVAILQQEEILSFTKAEAKEVWNGKVMTLLKLGKYADAIDCCNAALEIKPSWTLKSVFAKIPENAENEIFWNSKGLVLSYQKNYPDALNCYDHALQLNISSKDALAGKAYILFYQMNFDKAEIFFEKALNLDPYFTYALQGKGLIAYQRENFKQAEEYLQKAEAQMSPDKSFPEWGELFCRQGLAFIILKAWDKAQKAFEKALIFDPKCSPAKNELKDLPQVSKPEPDIKKNKEISQLHQRVPENQLQIDQPFLKVKKPLLLSTTENKSFATLEIFFHISHNEIKFDKELGRGGFGIVFQGTWRYNDVAIKQLQSTQLSKDALEEFQSEMQIMARLRSPNIVQLYGITDKTPYCMVMEYLPKGDLYNLLHSKEELRWEQRAQIALDITRGLAYLHKENIMHRDLKSKNVLLDKSLQAKLADFGLAKIKTESSVTSTGKIVGTLAWMAPELFKRKAEYTLKADIYSYGMVVWELSSRKIPFADAKGNQSLIAKWVSEGEREEIPKDTPKKLAELIEVSWAQESKDRPTAEQAIQRLQEETTSTSSATKSSEYRSNFDSTSIDSGYRDNLESEKSFRP